MEKIILETFEEISDEGLTVDELFYMIKPKLIKEMQEKLTQIKLNIFINKMLKGNKLVRYCTPIERINGKFTHYIYVLPRYSRPFYQEEKDYYRIFSSVQFSFLNLFSDKSSRVSHEAIQKYFDLITSLIKYKMQHNLPEPEIKKLVEMETESKMETEMESEKNTKNISHTDMCE